MVTTVFHGDVLMIFYSWASLSDLPEGSDDITLTKKPYVCHAEMNAILNGKGFDVPSDCVIYVTDFPCNECAKLIIQFGIKKVIYLRNDKENSWPQ